MATITVSPAKQKSGFDVRVMLAFAAIYVLWGSTYLAIRIAVQQVPPLFATGTRFFLAGTLLYAEISGRKGVNRFYAFDDDGRTEFLDEAGRQTGGLLLRTPVDAARVSSKPFTVRSVNPAAMLTSARSVPCAWARVNMRRRIS